MKAPAAPIAVARQSNRLGTSVLFALEPRGVGTPFVESLTGYVRRLARAHGRRHTVLIEQLIRKPYRQQLGGSQPDRDRPLATHGQSANGRGHLATALTEYLEALTWVHEIRQLSVLGWASSVDVEDGMRQFCAWCPRCLADDETPYERLIWSFTDLTVCPVHECLLVDACRVCGRQWRPLEQRTLLTTCGKCSTPYADRASRPTSSIDAASQVIVDMVDRHQRGRDITREQVRRGASAFVASCGSFKEARARAGRGRMHAIVRGDDHVSLPTLVAIIVASGEDLEAFLGRPLAKLKRARSRPRHAARNIAAGLPRWNEAARELERLLASGEPLPALLGFLEQRGIGIRTMRTRFPGLTDRYVARGREGRAERKRRRLAAELAQVEDATRELLATNSYTASELGRRLPKWGLLLDPNLRRRVRELVSEQRDTGGNKP